MAIKNPAPTAVIPNPMHKFASWSYTWSLWWLNVNDYNSLSSADDVSASLANRLLSNSYVVAEDSGLYPNSPNKQYRLPTIPFGLNYNIQDVEFTTVVGLNSSSKSSNMIQGSMTIVEPYGVTLIDALVAASRRGDKYQNYTEQPYMLQLDFKGWDDSGNPVPDSEVAIYRKRFPIKVTGIKVGVTNKGSEYKLSFIPAGHQAHDEGLRTVPKQFNIIASTVKEFFTNLSTQVNEHWDGEAQHRQADFPDAIYFDIDSTIGDSKIVTDKETPLLKANPKGVTLDLATSEFKIPAGTPFVDVITRVMAQSDYLINLQLGLEKTNPNASQTQVFNAFKTVTSVTYPGGDAGFDTARNTRPKKITYKIHQYPNWDSNHPALPQFPDSTLHTAKSYNYLYTGKNVDILDLKINFDTTYYTSVLTYNRQNASTQTSQSTGIDLFRIGQPSTLLSPSLLTKFLPGLGDIPTVSPLRYRSAVVDQNITVGNNTTDRPGSIVAMDALKSIYSRPSGDMVTVDLSIVGDPTLIKQDDWLYTPSPTNGSSYNSWTSMGQDQFVAKYGHVRMDSGMLIATLRINTPLDIDAEYNNSGLVYPDPAVSTSLFSGQYKILTISNKFAGGKFEQVLKLVRIMNSDFSKAFGGSTDSARTTTTGNQENTNDPVSVNQASQKQEVPSNNATVAGDVSKTLSPGETIVSDPYRDGGH